MAFNNIGVERAISLYYPIRELEKDGPKNLADSLTRVISQKDQYIQLSRSRTVERAFNPSSSQIIALDLAKL
jgi:hypothetical protein